MDHKPETLEELLRFLTDASNDERAIARDRNFTEGQRRVCSTLSLAYAHCAGLVENIIKNQNKRSDVNGLHSDLY